MSRSALRSRLALAASVLVAVAFGFAGMTKLGDPSRFATDIGNYRLVPPLLAAAFALYLPWLEITLAVGLVAPSLRRAARWLALLLLGGFCVALLSAIIRGLDIRCGCFGGGDKGGLTAGWALARNSVLIALLLLAGADQSSIEGGRNSK